MKSKRVQYTALRHLPHQRSHNKRLDVRKIHEGHHLSRKLFNNYLQSTPQQVQGEVMNLYLTPSSVHLLPFPQKIR
jgi:hypothetical protein